MNNCLVDSLDRGAPPAGRRRAARGEDRVTAAERWHASVSVTGVTWVATQRA
jgi:hypothetical protein